ncbi:RNA polymerase sigma factor SigZ [Pseudoteredinibacter isoporae]|uniref:RNA polymerase sigma factor SigZ n=1 Tax=Pseudoteredinibacter isoporae TaxID=570281 RepID=A0A7X0MV22_9GAMM|nr:RNA polymerase sigma factor SigZ [Pseudoteredinibacter isoporae]MBB6520620.1 RNA polymerase sigma-70 factor (ECF subfamily) [Pseudoteredinibacter isoporae]NHO86187.1 RNA polymerase sigma factor SigZ [Pseudoteredinibacter isoporae]NIB25362.1 RNA polymerase sigma factor SigZ [Pseudoteredinibacter isoporae]
MSIEAIWDEYRSALTRFLTSRVSNPADVEDLLQDILIKSYKNLHTVKSSDSIKAWLFQLANNTIIDHYRKKAKGKDLQAEDLWYEEDLPNIKAELSMCILPFINALPEDQSKLLKAIDIDNVKQKDFAETNNIPYSTLKSRVQKSRQALRKLYEDCCHLTLDQHGNIIDYQRKNPDCDGCP